MPRTGGTQVQDRTHILKLCMDAKEDRRTYEKIKNDSTCRVVEKDFFSTPKGVVWAVVEYVDSMGVYRAVQTQSLDEDIPAGGVSNEEEN